MKGCFSIVNAESAVEKEEKIYSVLIFNYDDVVSLELAFGLQNK